MKYVNLEALVELEIHWNQLASHRDQMRRGLAEKKMQIFGAKPRSQLRIDVLKMC